jgi:predicted O-methyltransferase YrrM
MRIEMQPLVDASVLDTYAEEIVGSGLLSTITRAQAEFHQTVSGATARGHAYGFGGMQAEPCIRLYGLVRDTRPAVCVETGVCNGVSTTMMLAGIARNGAGILYSIDYPEHAGEAYPPDAFWPGKKGAVVPPGRQPGWIVPEPLRSRWRMTIGRSQEALAPLLDALGTIDLFLHDSEHSESCMRFEYELAWEHLRPGGVLVSDDVTWNMTFEEFAGRVGRTTVPLASNMALVVK